MEVCVWWTYCTVLSLKMCQNNEYEPVYETLWKDCGNGQHEKVTVDVFKREI